MANQSHLNKSRVDKFILAFNLPPILQQAKIDNTNAPTNDLNLQESIQYSVFGIIIPAISIPALDTPFAGHTVKTSTFARPSYEDVTVNFNVDNRFKNYRTIYEWLNILNDQESSTYDGAGLGSPTNREVIRSGPSTHSSIEYKNEYTTDMSLYGLDEFNKQIVHFKYREAFPVGLGSIGYNYQQESEITCTFTFTFSQLHFKLLAIN
jgi:hypothetical protein